MSIGMFGSVFVGALGTAGAVLGYCKETECRSTLNEYLAPLGDLHSLEENSLSLKVAKKALSFFSMLPAGLVGGALGAVCAPALVGNFASEKLKANSIEQKRDALFAILAVCNRELALCPKPEGGGIKVKQLIELRERRLKEIVDRWALPVDRIPSWKERFLAEQARRLLQTVIGTLKEHFFLEEGKGLVELMQVFFYRFPKETEEEVSQGKLVTECEKIAVLLLKKAYSIRLFSFGYNLPYVGKILKSLDCFIRDYALYPVWKISAKFVAKAALPFLQRILSPDNLRLLYLRGIGEVKSLIRDRESPENPLVSLEDKEALEMGIQGFLGVLYDEVALRGLLPFTGEKKGVKKGLLCLRQRGMLQELSEEEIDSLVERVIARKARGEEEFNAEEQLVSQIIDSKVKEQVVQLGSHFLANKLLKAVYFEGEVEVERILLALLSPGGGEQEPQQESFFTAEKKALRELQEEIFCFAFAKDPELEGEIFAKEMQAIFQETEDFVSELEKVESLSKPFKGKFQERAISLSHFVSKLHWIVLKIKGMAGEDVFLTGVSKLLENIRSQVKNTLEVQKYTLALNKELFGQWHIALCTSQGSLEEFQKMSEILFPSDVELQEDAEALFLLSKEEKVETLFSFMEEVEEMYEEEKKAVALLEDAWRNSVEELRKFTAVEGFLQSSFKGSYLSLSRTGAVSLGRQMVEELPKEKRKAFVAGIENLLESEKVAKGVLLSFLKALSYRIKNEDKW